VKQEEHYLQACVVDWACWNMRQYPELDLLHAVANGAPLGGGRIGAMRMNYLKAEGLRPGVCDLFLPVARGGYFGCYLEMKTKTGKLSENQKEFIAAVEKQGYLCCVAYGADEAIEFLERYLQMPKTQVVKA
jgi:VRR-NUC domain